jgi:hypothetical protein
MTTAPDERRSKAEQRVYADIQARITGLIAETWFYRDPFAPLGAPAGNYLLAALGLHALAKSVCLRSLAPVGLECTLGHEKYLLLIRLTVFGQTMSINHPRHYLQTALPPGRGSFLNF